MRFIIYKLCRQSMIQKTQAGRPKSLTSSRWIIIAAAAATTSILTPCQGFSVSSLPTRKRLLSYRFSSTQTPEESQMTQDALTIVKEAIRAVDPATAVNTHVESFNGRLEIGSKQYHARDYDRIILLAFGKASSAMATALIDRIEESMPTLPVNGVVIVKDDHATQDELHALQKHEIRLQEASHPVPDVRSVDGATSIVDMVRHYASDRTLVLCCISGGGSALFCAPRPPLSLEDLQDANLTLLSSGLSIQQMNVIRKRLELAKGGRLAIAAYPSTVATLVLSDILGDPLDLIASGPTVPDSSTWQDAWNLVQSNAILKESLPQKVLNVLQDGADGKLKEEIPYDAFDKCHTVLVGNNELAVTAAAKEAQRLGYHSIVLGTRIEGEARHVAGVYTAMAQHLSCQRNSELPFSMAKLPAAIIAGGETTVTLAADTKGMGGRNQELALAAAIQLHEMELRNVVLASVGTDGTDGPTDAAGAVVDGATVNRLDGSAEQALKEHNAYTYFKQHDEASPLVMTGPTGTNVADVCVTLVR